VVENQKKKKLRKKRKKKGAKGKGKGDVTTDTLYNYYMGKLQSRNSVSSSMGQQDEWVEWSKVL
jgi:hypothetical protein